MFGRLPGSYGTAPRNESELVAEAITKATSMIRQEDTSSAIRATAWYAKAAILDSNEIFQGNMPILAADTGIVLGRKQPVRSEALGSSMFLCVMLGRRGISITIPENSTWIAYWGQDKRNLFHDIASNGLVIDFDQPDAKLQGLLALAKSNLTIFNQFFSYCFDVNILSSYYATKLGIEYRPSTGQQYGENQSLIDGTRLRQ